MEQELKRQKQREWYRTWYAKNKEKEAERKRQPEVLAKRREHYAKNKNKIRAAVKADRKTNPEKYREYDKKRWKTANRMESQKQYRISIREKVFKHYGNKCKCCGESTTEFLSIDHIKRDGARHRREFLGSNESGGSHRMRLWIIKNNYPKTLQLLCMNCNLGRERNNGVCPHKRRKR